jgi:hypothetical protein
MSYPWNSTQFLESTKGFEWRPSTIAALSRRMFAWREAKVKPWAKLSDPFRAGFGSGFLPRRTAGLSPNRTSGSGFRLSEQFWLSRRHRSVRAEGWLEACRGGYVEHRRNHRGALKESDNNLLILGRF